MIKCHLQFVIKKQYFQEVQCLYKTSAFENAATKDLIRYCNVLKNIVAQAKAIVHLLSSLVPSVKSITYIQNQASNMSNIKSIVILIILSSLAH